MPIRTILLLLLRAAFLGRYRLVLENLAMRQQIAALRRKRPQLQAHLREYIAYYNQQRCHLALERDAPVPRTRERTPALKLKATPVLGGLHHRYERAA